MAKLTTEEALELVAKARKELEAFERAFVRAIQAASRAGATMRELEGPSGLKKTRVAQIVKGDR